jgi:Glyoxalase-like domain
LELDHIFCFIAPDGPEIDLLKDLGLHETYRRNHVGQGTANVCFAFENAFLELLWITDPLDAASSAIEQTGLLTRGQWRTKGSCPFGIAWRNGGKSIPIWAFAPPYLPAGVTIGVATDGDDAYQPMMFTFPGSTPPTDWESKRHKGFQRRGGYTVIEAVELSLPQSVAQQWHRIWSLPNAWQAGRHVR